MTGTARRCGWARWAGMLAATVVAILHGTGARAETGAQLWLRYGSNEDEALRAAYRRTATALVVLGKSPTAQITLSELKRGLGGLLSRDVPVSDSVDRDGVVLVATSAESPAVAGLGWSDDLARAGAEG